MAKQNQNKFFITGHVANDPVYRTYGEKGKDLKFTVANNRGFGEYAKAYFFQCKVWGKNAENLQTFLSKGTYVALSGEMTIETWVDKDTQGTRHATLLVADECEILSPKSSSGGGGNSSNYDPGYSNQGYGGKEQAPAWVAPESDSIPF